VFGRPTLYRPEYCQRAIEFMGQGYSVTALAGHLGMSKDAIYDWINLYPDFCHAIKMGRAARVAALETKLLTTSQGVGVTAAIFALKNADPDEWQDRCQTETKVAVSIEHMPDAELLAKFPKRTPALIEAKPVKAATDVTDTAPALTNRR
jgi:transposase